MATQTGSTYISETMSDISSKFQRQIPNFWQKLDKSVAELFRQRWTARNGKIGAQNVYLTISGRRSLLQSPEDSFCKDEWSKNPCLLCWNIDDSCHTVEDISTSGLVATLLLPFVGQFVCGHLLWACRGRRLCFCHYCNNTYFRGIRVYKSTWA